jgi:hypothetical protein
MARANQHKILAWQETKTGLVFIVLFDILAAYIFASLAIGSGRLSEYTVALIFLGFAIAQAVKFFKKVLRRG